MRNVTLFLIAIIFMYSSKAMACEPCAANWDLQESINNAELIVVGKRITPMQEQEEKQEGGPEYVDIAVESTLKGTLVNSPLSAKAWYDMCPYGVVTPVSKPHIMLMKKSKDNIHYESLNNGCAVTVLALENNQVITRDGIVGLEQFKQLIR